MARLMLKNVRLAFLDAWTAKKPPQGDGVAKFGVTCLIELGSENDKLIEAAIEEVGKEKFKDKWPRIKKSILGNNMKYCYRPEGEKDYDGYEGMNYIRASNKTRPTILDRDKTPLVEADGRPYSGCYGNVSIDIYGYDNSGAGIAAGLRGIQFFRDGDSFGGGAAASEDEFDDLADTGEGGETGLL